MKKLTILIFMSCLLLFSSCCKKTVMKESYEDINTKLPADLLKGKSEKIISPGTADILCEVLSFTDKGEWTNSKLKILEVNNSGSSTPPLAIGEEIYCDISEYLIKKFKPEFAEGQKHNILMQFQIAVDNGDTVSGWRAINIK